MNNNLAALGLGLGAKQFSEKPGMQYEPSASSTNSMSAADVQAYTELAVAGVDLTVGLIEMGKEAAEDDTQRVNETFREKWEEADAEVAIGMVVGGAIGAILGGGVGALPGATIGAAVGRMLDSLL